MHAKSDSEVTSISASSPPRPLYYVQSPSHSDKMSYGSTPFGSPAHHHFHSRESSTSRFSASLNNPTITFSGGSSAFRLMHHPKYSQYIDGADDDAEGGGSPPGHVRFYVLCFVLSFAALFSIFSLILWAASLTFPPNIIVKSICFDDFKIQAGMDATGVPTDMLTLNSTVRISYKNPATFFAVHVASTPVELHYFGLKLASGHVKSFYQSRKSQVNVTAVVQGHQVPLYGGIPLLDSAKDRLQSVSVELNLTFVMRSRAYILGRLVKTKFYQRVLCRVTFRGDYLGKPLNLAKYESCVYRA